MFNCTLVKVKVNKNAYTLTYSGLGASTGPQDTLQGKKKVPNDTQFTCCTCMIIKHITYVYIFFIPNFPADSIPLCQK